MRDDSDIALRAVPQPRSDPLRPLQMRIMRRHIPPFLPMRVGVQQRGVDMRKELLDDPQLARHIARMRSGFLQLGEGEYRLFAVDCHGVRGKSERSGTKGPTKRRGDDELDIAGCQGGLRDLLRLFDAQRGEIWVVQELQSRSAGLCASLNGVPSPPSHYVRLLRGE